MGSVEANLVNEQHREDLESRRQQTRRHLSVDPSLSTYPFGIFLSCFKVESL